MSDAAYPSRPVAAYIGMASDTPTIPVQKPADVRVRTPIAQGLLALAAALLENGSKECLESRYGILRMAAEVQYGERHDLDRIRAILAEMPELTRESER